MVKVDLGFGLKMVKACDPGARLKMVKVPRLPDPYFPPGREGLELYTEVRAPMRYGLAQGS